MRVVGHRLVPYALPLTEPVTWGGTPHRQRAGVLLRLDGADGAVGWGDAAPLPGFSRESLAEAHAAVVTGARAVTGRDLDPLDVVSLTSPLHEALDAAGLPSSARFAVDLALADLARQWLGQSLPKALHADAPASLPLNALVLGEGAVAQARARAEEGYAAVKLKVGRAAVADDLATVAAVREASGPGVALRLDANRAWSDADARAFAAAVGEVAYVEEPLADPAGGAALSRDTGLPIALDESIQDGASVEAWAAAAILKPTLVGGLAATLRIAASARARGVPVVLSAAFESGVGLRGVAALAAATGAEPAGLDTYRWLAADVLPALPFSRPTVDLDAVFATPLEVRVP